MTTKKTTAKNDGGSRPQQGNPAESKVKETDNQASIEDLLKTVNSLSEEDLLRLRHAGFVTPAVESEAEFDSPTKGYRCDYCGEIGLYFTGTKFQQPDGSFGPNPHPQVPIANLPWTQRVPLEHQNRTRPECQCCGAELRFNVSRGVKPQNVKNVKDYEKARKASIDPEVEAAMRSASGNYDGAPPSRDYNMPNRKASEMMSPEAKEDLTRLAESHDLVNKIASGTLSAPIAKR